MSEAIWVLRAISLLAFSGLMAIGICGQRREKPAEAAERRGSRLPVLVNFAAFALFFTLLVTQPGGSERPMQLLLAAGGAFLALAGMVTVSRSRRELGAAWSFIPKAGEQPGIVTSGPYALVRHPIYLGLSMLALGESVAFSSPPASAGRRGASRHRLWRELYRVPQPNQADHSVPALSSNLSKQAAQQTVSVKRSHTERGIFAISA
jgi:protein-S-isoprenylcysteine O-methyltransferase Ste14